MNKIKISLEKDDGNIKVMSGSGSVRAILKPHLASETAHFFCTAGVISFFIKEEHHILNQGDYLTIPNQTIHHLEVIEDCQFYLIFPSNTKLNFVKN